MFSIPVRFVVIAALSWLGLTLSVPPSALAGDASTDDVPAVHTPDDSNMKWMPCPDFMPESCRLSILQGDPAKANADIFFKLSGNSATPRHWHTSAERMILVTGEMTIEYDGHPARTVSPGAYLYGPPSMPHVASCVSDEPCVLFIAFEDPIDAFQGAAEDR